MIEVICFVIVKINIAAAGHRTVTGTCRIIPDDGEVFKPIEIYIAKLYGAVFNNPVTAHNLAQLPVIFFHKEEEQVPALETYNSMLFFIGANVSLVELYAGGIAIKNGCGIKAGLAFMTIEVPDAVIFEKRHLLGAVHCLIQ